MMTVRELTRAARLQRKLRQAKRLENLLDSPVYVAWSPVAGRWIFVIDKPPTLLEWYTTDGIRHG